MVVAALGVSALGLPACGFFDLGDDGDSNGETDGPQFCEGGDCDGVWVACENPGAIPQSNPGGADSGSGGGADGGDSGDPPENWYWDHCDPGVVTDLGCEPDDEYCCTPGFDACYCKNYDNSKTGTAQSIGDVCVGPGNPNGIDPVTHWVDGSFPGFETQIHSLCEARCKQLSVNVIGFPLPACDAATWGTPITTNDWDPDKPLNCQMADELNKSDPFGIGVPWALVGGGSSALPLSCDLTDTCADMFVPDVRPWVVTPTEAAAIPPETRGAQYLAGSDPANRPEFFVSVDYKGTRYDETNPIYGLSEYSRSDCGKQVCPFYLANLTASNSVDEWTVPVKLDNGDFVVRTFGDLEVDLLQSTLGVENVALGKIAFAPGTLRLSVAFDVRGREYGSGPHSFLVENEEFVFADVTSKGIELDYSFSVQSLGTATLRLPLVPDEHPPEAAHDLVENSAACSYELTAASMQSSDPDHDLVEQYWVADGSICGDPCILGPGSHEITLVASDSRGAIDVTDPHQINVSGC